MKVLSEEKIVVTRTTYGFDTTKEHGPFAVESEEIKVELDGQPVFKKRIAEHLLRKQFERCSPVECFIDYILTLNGKRAHCHSNETVRDKVVKIINEMLEDVMPLSEIKTAGVHLEIEKCKCRINNKQE